MERIIIRLKTVSPPKVTSNLTKFESDEKYKDFNELVKRNGYKKILKLLVDDDIDNDDLYQSNLYKNYLEVKKLEKENELFKIIYKLNNKYGVELTEHIYLYQFVSNFFFFDQMIVPWYYTSKKIYLADTWWSSDEEIINDFFNMPFLDFIVKYKIY